VRVTVGDVVRDGTGYGSGIDRDLGAAHESAVKEAETDAMKRALMTFGNPFGLALYDKTKANVDYSHSPSGHAAPVQPVPQYRPTPTAPPPQQQAPQQQGGGGGFQRDPNETAADVWHKVAKTGNVNMCRAAIAKTIQLMGKDNAFERAKANGIPHYEKETVRAAQMWIDLINDYNAEQGIPMGNTAPPPQAQAPQADPFKDDIPF
jgi:hypothetical protein